MLSNSRSQTAREAGQHVREMDGNFQLSGECSMGTEQTLYCQDLYEDFLPPAVSDDTYQGMLLPASALKSESDQFGGETGLGMDT